VAAKSIEHERTKAEFSCSPADGFIVCLVSSSLPLAVFLLSFSHIKGRIIFQIKLYNIATFDKPLGYQAALHLEKVDLLRLIDCTNYTSKSTTANYTPNSNFYLQYLRAMAIYWFHQHIDLVNKRADPLTPRRTSSLESTYVPQASLDKSNISGGTCTQSS